MSWSIRRAVFTLTAVAGLLSAALLHTASAQPARRTLPAEKPLPPDFVQPPNTGPGPIKGPDEFSDSITLPKDNTLRDKLIVVARNDGEDEKLDLEIGYALTRLSNATIRLPGNALLTASELPAVESMARS